MREDGNQRPMVFLLSQQRAKNLKIRADHVVPTYFLRSWILEFLERRRSPQHEGSLLDRPSPTRPLRPLEEEGEGEGEGDDPGGILSLSVFSSE